MYHYLFFAVQVIDSKTFVEFGTKYLSKPGPRSKMKARQFKDLPSEVVLLSKANERPVKTLTGISKKFEIVFLPDGTIKWRR